MMQDPYFEETCAVVALILFELRKWPVSMEMDVSILKNNTFCFIKSDLPVLQKQIMPQRKGTAIFVAIMK